MARERLLYELARDRALESHEIHLPNDFYGHASVLKRYVGLPAEHQIKAVIEHGPMWGSFVWDMDANSPLPAMLVPAPSRRPVLERATGKAIFSIGPMLNYASHAMDAAALDREKQRLGRNLLAFPAHSTHWVDADFDGRAYRQDLEAIGREFNTIRVCLYWKDVLRGLARDYEAGGIECVTAGHMFDPMFLPRLKSILETATVTTSNEIGTHVGYSILMGKPHYWMKAEVRYTSSCGDIPARDSQGFPAEGKEEMERAFSDLRYDISPEQRDLVRRYWGTDEQKTADQLEAILQITEEMYQRTRSQPHGARRTCETQLPGRSSAAGRSGAGDRP